MGSACYVYAIVGRDTPMPAADRQNAAELAMIAWRDLAAVTGRTGDGDAPLTMEAVLQHETIVEAVRRQGPSLPVRFGTVFRDATSVASALAARYETLAADLARLGDKVELGLTVLWAAPPSGESATSATLDDAAPAAQSAGARYLHARAAEFRRDDALRARARTVAAELELALGALALERRESLLPTPRVAVRTAYLLEPAGVGAFRAAVETIRATRGALRVLLTGPWPPYSFVSRTGSEGGVGPGGRLTTLLGRLTEEMRGRPG